MKKLFLFLALGILLCGCTKEIETPIANAQQQREIKQVEQINCQELEKQTWDISYTNKRINYEERKKQIDYYYDRCTRENHDRWYSLGLEALIVADQVETEQEKIKYLQISYNNFAKSVKDDGFMAGLEAIAVGKEYYKINQYDEALKWYEKAKPYYEKVSHSKLGYLPVWMGDAYMAMGDYGSAYVLYNEGLDNFVNDINPLAQEHIEEIRGKIEKIEQMTLNVE